VAEITVNKLAFVYSNSVQYGSDQIIYLQICVVYWRRYVPRNASL